MTPSPSKPIPASLYHPGRWLWLFLLLPVALGLARLRFDVEIFDLLPNDLPAVTGLRLYQEHFSNARELVVTLTAPTPEQAEAAARSIAERLRLETNFVTSVTFEPPWLEHPDQAAELMGYLWFNQGPAAFRELAERLAPDKLADILSAAREELATSMSPQEIARLSYDPFGLTRLPQSAAGAAPAFGEGQESFGSPDGKFRILFVQAKADLRTYRECAQWLQRIKSVAQSALEMDGDSKSAILGFTGRPAFVSEIAHGMQRDVTISVGGTAGIIALLFWLAHRRAKPMLWLLTLLALILACTLALGGLIFGAINVVSMGFAAILLGLAVDYAVVHYQEALAHPNLTIPQIRHAIAPSIFWAAVTTITAFLVLNFGGLPGLGQLGTLVGLGVALAATIMIFEFLPPLFPARNRPPSPALEHRRDGLRFNNGDQLADKPAPSRLTRDRLGFAVTLILIIATIAVLSLGRPQIDTTADALRPRQSPAYDAVAQIQANMNQKKEPLWLIFSGASVDEAGSRLEAAQAVLEKGVATGLIAGFTLPTPLWPRPAYQSANRETARLLVAKRALLREAAQTNGFAESALGLTERILDTWQIAGETRDLFWPTNPMSQWIFNKLSARTPTNYFALGLVNALTNGASVAAASRLAILQSQLPQNGVWLSGWELLGHAIFGRVETNLWKVLAPMIVLVLLSLFLAFRRPLEIALSLAVLLLSGLFLLTVMRLAGWSWNLLNLMAIPMVLGTGVDYSIFMQLALRRFGGDREVAYRSVGRALLLCGGTAIAGFGFLGLSSNAGMASLGRVCAVGIGSNMLIAIFLLPAWWARLAGSPILKAQNPGANG